MAATSAQGSTALFVQGVANGGAFDTQYATDIAMLRGYSAPATPIGALDLGNWGGWPWISVGREGGMLRRSILRFPLNRLAGKTLKIKHARLILSLVAPARRGLGIQTLTTPIHLELYRIRDANAGWSEGLSNAGASTSDAVCWAGRGGSVKPWTGGKGCSLAGTDFDAAPVSSATLGTAGWANTGKLIFELRDTDFLQNWISHPENNAGFLLSSSTLEALPDTTMLYAVDLFSDDENTDAKDPALRSPTLRPRLEIEYDTQSAEALATAPFQAGVAGRTPNPAYDMQATSLFSGRDGSYGASDELRVGVEQAAPGLAGQPWRSLLRFGLAPLRGWAGAVRSARLTLWVKSVRSATGALEAFHLFQLDRVCPANAGWREGTRADGGTEPGAATWNWLAQDSLAWAGGNPLGRGLGVSGIDYDGQPLSQRLLVPGELLEGDPVTFDLSDTDFLWGWIFSAASNGGFRLTAPTLESAGQDASAALEEVSFYSDDTTQTAKRPRLEIDYSTTFKPSAANQGWLKLR